MGIHPAALGIIPGSMFRLVPASTRSARQTVILVAATGLAMAGLPPLAVLAFGAIGGLVPLRWLGSGRDGLGLRAVVPAPLLAAARLDPELLARLGATLL